MNRDNRDIGGVGIFRDFPLHRTGWSRQKMGWQCSMETTGVHHGCVGTVAIQGQIFDSFRWN